jgi:hypothetical protein
MRVSRVLVENSPGNLNRFVCSHRRTYKGFFSPHMHYRSGRRHQLTASTDSRFAPQRPLSVVFLLIERHDLEHLIWRPCLIRV